MAKAWEERRPGFHVYYNVDNKTQTFGDVRSMVLDWEQPCVYDAICYTPLPDGTSMGRHSSFEGAKTAVEEEVIRQGL